MEEYKIKNWRDFWNIFNKLICLLRDNNQLDVVLDFRDAQKYVNGFTDGWYEFMIAFEKAIETHKENLTIEELNIAVFLKNYLSAQLS